MLSFLKDGMNLYYPLCVYIFHYSETLKCYAGISMTLTLFCTPAYFNKRNLTFIKLGTNDVNMPTLWRHVVIVSRAITFFLAFLPKRNRNFVQSLVLDLYLFHSRSWKRIVSVVSTCTPLVKLLLSIFTREISI